ncbi:MAG: adenylate/guanylate cyclase domain-containing protein [Candidatus Binataceae bacterium]|nr:adenylate/guanylate cyclase domain-containing protein [Candidatus Binataceae bacterium]
MAAFSGKPFWKNPLVTVCIGLAMVAVITGLNRDHGLEALEQSTSDRLVYSHGVQSPPTGQVVIARIDEQSIADLGRWPWGRDVEARLVNALAEYKVAVIGFDVLMTERDSADVLSERLARRLKHDGVHDPAVLATLSKSDDAEFAHAMKAQGTSYLGYTFGPIYRPARHGGATSAAPHAATSGSADFLTSFTAPRPMFYNFVRKTAGAQDFTTMADRYLPPIALLNSAAGGTGYVNLDLDSDGVARSYPAVIRFHDRYCVPLFMAVVDAYAAHAPLSLGFDRVGVSNLQVDGARIPVDELGRLTVHYRGPAGTIPSYSIADIVAHRVPPAALEKKIVMIGLTGHGLGDRFVTPVGGDFPGVEIQANAIDNVLAGDFLVSNRELFVGEELAGLVIGIAIIFVAAYLTAISGAMIAIILAVGYVLFALHLLRADGEILGVVFPLMVLGLTYLVVMSWRYISEGAEKRHLRHVFEHYMNPDVINSVVDNPDGLKIGGERRHLSILFSDIVNFTSRAERTDPEPLVALLNTYMTVMIRLIFESGGVVDKLMGDGIMAFWGAPVAIENPAREAIQCALRMMEELAALAARDERFSDLKIGIGVATGDAVVGNFGGEQRFDYSVIGDIVNLASRLEGLTRPFKVGILVNRPTFEEAGPGFIGREIGLVKVKGKDQLVATVEVVGREGDGVDPEFYARFAKAIDLLHKGYSPEGELRAMLKDRPDDRVVAMCLERLAAAPEGRRPREIVFEFDTK